MEYQIIFFLQIQTLTQLLQDFGTIVTKHWYCYQAFKGGKNKRNFYFLLDFRSICTIFAGR